MPEYARRIAKTRRSSYTVCVHYLDPYYKDTEHWGFTLCGKMANTPVPADARSWICRRCRKVAEGSNMNPDTNRFEPLVEKPNEPRNQQREMERRLRQLQGQLVRPDGSPVPKHWSVFTVGEDVVIKDYTFRVAYIGETNILFEPVGPVVLEGVDAPKDD